MFTGFELAHIDLMSSGVRECMELPDGEEHVQRTKVFPDRW